MDGRTDRLTLLWGCDHARTHLITNASSLTGAIRDGTGSYVYSFLWGGGVMVFGAILILSRKAWLSLQEQLSREKLRRVWQARRNDSTRPLKRDRWDWADEAKLMLFAPPPSLGCVHIHKCLWSFRHYSIARRHEFHGQNYFYLVKFFYYWFCTHQRLTLYFLCFMICFLPKY